MVLRDVQNGSSETWCLFLILTVKVLSWNVSGDLFVFVADFDAHDLHVEIEAFGK